MKVLAVLGLILLGVLCLGMGIMLAVACRFLAVLLSCDDENKSIWPIVCHIGSYVAPITGITAAVICVLVIFGIVL